MVTCREGEATLACVTLRALLSICIKLSGSAAFQSEGPLPANDLYRVKAQYQQRKAPVAEIVRRSSPMPMCAHSLMTFRMNRHTPTTFLRLLCTTQLKAWNGLQAVARYRRQAWAGALSTLSMPRAFMVSTTPSRGLLTISGGVCSGKVLQKKDDEYSLQIAKNALCQRCRLRLSADVCVLTWPKHQSQSTSCSYMWCG